VAVAAFMALGLAYLAARETSLFAVRQIEVIGAPPAVERAVQEAAAPFAGESLVDLDRTKLSESLAALPSLRSFQVDRAFPHTLRITVVPERPAAVLRSGRDAWLVSERGRVIASVEKDAWKSLPRIRLAGQSPPVPGAVLEGGETGDALAAVAALPARLAGRVRSVSAREGSIDLVLRTGPELRLGAADRLALKMAVAAAVLRALPADDREALDYVDVSTPERPVAGNDPQVSGLP
jgi:cell division protein FtsQ